MSDLVTPKRTRKPVTKKEKKPIQVVAVVTPEGIEGSFTPEARRPLIVHLPFSSNDIEFNNTRIESAPQPFDTEGQVYFQVNTIASSAEKQIGVEKEGWKMEIQPPLVQISVNTNAPPLVQKAPENFTRAQLLTCYASKPGETFHLPEKTEVACFWCTCEFENQPCFLPVREDMGTYHVYGNFCSPQCALSYLIEEHLDSHVRWERMSLLHRMYKGKGDRLYPAPSSESLKKFGGVYTIQEYRNIITENRLRVDIQSPPMTSILATLDTKPIDFYDSSLQNTFTDSFSMDRFKSWSEQGGALRLKRSKPLKDKESTLDACFEISVKKGDA